MWEGAINTDHGNVNVQALGILVRSKRARNGGMAASSKPLKAAKRSAAKSPSLTSITKRTRTQLAAPTGQKAAVKTESSLSIKEFEVPYSPGQLKAEEEEEPITGMNTQL